MVLRVPAASAALVLLAGLASAAPAWAVTDRGSVDRKDGFRDAVTAPLEDLNLKQADIPAVLRRAVADPYDVKGLDRCEAIAAEIGRIDAALGPDLDEAPPPDTRNRRQKLGGQAHDAAVGAVKDHTRDLLPFRGWVRKLTGADKHAKAVQAAIRSGGIRRGYLKGVGMRQNCAPPAAPSWFVPEKPKTPASAWDSFWSGLVKWWRSWWPF